MIKVAYFIPYGIDFFAFSIDKWTLLHLYNKYVKYIA